MNKTKAKKIGEQLVSVFMPSYNHKEFIAEALDSVLLQDYSNIEIICGDDCSADKTQSIIKKYEKKYPEKILGLYNKTNLGITKNFNNILDHCKGKYIIFFSGDDIMLPGKISRLVSFMEKNPDHAICYHDLEVFKSKSGKAICKYTDLAHPPKSTVNSLLTPGTFVIGPCIIIRSDCLPAGGFNPALSTLADWFLMIEVSTKGKIGYINEVLGRYRRHGDNISRKKEHYPEYFISIGMLRAKYPNLTRQISDFEGYIMLCFMVNCFRKKDFDKAFIYAQEAYTRRCQTFKLLPLVFANKLRCKLTKNLVDNIIYKIFSIIDKIYNAKKINYKV